MRHPNCVPPSSVTAPVADWPVAGKSVCWWRGSPGLNKGQKCLTADTGCLYDSNVESAWIAKIHTSDDVSMGSTRNMLKPGHGSDEHNTGPVHSNQQLHTCTHLVHRSRNWTGLDENVLVPVRLKNCQSDVKHLSLTHSFTHSGCRWHIQCRVQKPIDYVTKDAIVLPLLWPPFIAITCVSLQPRYGPRHNTRPEQSWHAITSYLFILVTSKLSVYKWRKRQLGDAPNVSLGVEKATMAHTWLSSTTLIHTSE